MSERDDGGPAFPTTRAEEVETGELGLQGVLVSYPGMSLWDYYAAAALTGMLASSEWLPMSGKEAEVRYARAAAIQADTMLAERRKRFGGSQ